MKRFTKAAAATVLTAGLLGGSVALAAPASAAACGFTPITTGSIGGGDDGRYEKGTYNNCKDRNVRVTISYFYTSETKCLSPGETTLYANPNKGALTGAKWTGAYCTG